MTNLQEVKEKFKDDIKVCLELFTYNQSECYLVVIDTFNPEMVWISSSPNVVELEKKNCIPPYHQNKRNFVIILEIKKSTFKKKKKQQYIYCKRGGIRERVLDRFAYLNAFS